MIEEYLTHWFAILPLGKSNVCLIPTSGLSTELRLKGSPQQTSSNVGIVDVAINKKCKIAG